MRALTFVVVVGFVEVVVLGEKARAAITTATNAGTSQTTRINKEDASSRTTSDEMHNLSSICSIAGLI